MSTTTHASSQSSGLDTYECQYCDEEFREDKGYTRQYCSRECNYLGMAHGVLTALTYDHTRCASCFRRLKEVFHPGEFYINQRGDLKPTPEYFVGVEYAEPGYEWDIGEAFVSDIEDDELVVKPAGVQSTKVCECGVTHHTTVAFGPTDDGANFKQNLSKGELSARAQRLIEYADHGHDKAIDHDALFAKLRGLKEELPDKGADWRILKYALAAGLREGTP